MTRLLLALWALFAFTTLPAATAELPVSGEAPAPSWLAAPDLDADSWPCAPVGSPGELEELEDETNGSKELVAAHEHVRLDGVALGARVWHHGAYVLAHASVTTRDHSARSPPTLHTRARV